MKHDSRPMRRFARPTSKRRLVPVGAAVLVAIMTVLVSIATVLVGCGGSGGRVRDHSDRRFHDHGRRRRDHGAGGRPDDHGGPQRRGGADDPRLLRRL